MNNAICTVLVNDAKEYVKSLGGYPAYCKTKIPDLKSRCCLVGYLTRAAYVRGLLPDPPTTTYAATEALSRYFGDLDLQRFIDINDREGTAKAVEELELAVSFGH